METFSEFTYISVLKVNPTMAKIFRTQFCKSYFLYYYGRCVYFLNLKKNIAINNVIFGEGFLTAL